MCAPFASTILPMTSLTRLLTISLLGFVVSGCTMHDRDPQLVSIVIETEIGNIDIALDPVHAPDTVANFLRYVDAGRYDDGIFHRTVHLGNQPQNQVKIEVVQAGVNPLFEDKDDSPISLERTSKTAILHQDGTISMARDQPDSATSAFFICIGDQPSLDFGGARNPDGQGFAAFGHVTRGMDIVRRIQMSAAEGQKLTPPMRITKIRRVSTSR